MKIAICDDEAFACDRLEALVKNTDGSAEVYKFTSSRELLAAAEPFDVVFLDVLMPDPDGIEAARRLRKRDAGVCMIFVSSVKEYVFDAFDVAAFHYLVKPIDEQKFERVFSRARMEYEKARNQAPFTVVTRQETFLVKPAEVLYAESRLKKIVLHTTYSDITFYGDLAGLLKRLGDLFFRCHRGYLVNLMHIRSFSSNHIKLSDGSIVYMAKARYEAFQRAYIADFEQQNDHIRRMRHDMKNHIVVVTELLTRGDAREEAFIYLERLQKEYERSERTVSTGNIAVDALISAKLRSALQSMSSLRVDLDELTFLPNLCIEDYDLAILLGNAFDNAVESCERVSDAHEEMDLFLRMSSVIRGDTLLITVENTCLDDLDFSTEQGFPKTNKSEANAHGMGFRNMQSVAEKYHGALRWEAEDGVFTLSILLVNSIV